jgi:hypothetical protein
MVQGKAKAVVSGRTIAESDTWEVVEGNVYVCPPVSFNLLSIFFQSSFNLLKYTDHCSSHLREFRLHS